MLSSITNSKISRLTNWLVTRSYLRHRLQDHNRYTNHNIISILRIKSCTTSLSAANTRQANLQCPIHAIRCLPTYFHMQAESPKSERSKISSKVLIISRNVSNKSWMVPRKTLIDVISIFVGDIWRPLSNLWIWAARTIRNKLVANHPSRVVTRWSLTVYLLSIITRLTLSVIRLSLVSLHHYVPLVNSIIYLFVEIHSFNL